MPAGVAERLAAAQRLLEQCGPDVSTDAARARLEEAAGLVEGRSPKSLFEEISRDEPTLAPPAQRQPRRHEHTALSIEVFTRLGTALEIASEFAQAERAHRWAVFGALELGPGVPLAQALAREIVALAETHQFESLEPFVIELQTVCRTLTEQRQPEAAEAMLRLARALLEVGRLSEAEATALGARELALEGGRALARTAASADFARGWVAIFLGQVDLAEELAESSYDGIRRYGLEAMLPEAGALLGLAEVLAGRGEAGWSRLVIAAERAQDHPNEALRRLIALAQSAAALVMGNWSTARELARRAGSGRPPAPTIRRLLPQLVDAEACLRAFQSQYAGHRTPDEIRALLTRGKLLSAGVISCAGSHPFLALRAKRVSALCAAEQGLLDAMVAAEALKNVVRQAETVSGPLEAAQHLAALGRLGERLEHSDPQPLYREAADLARSAGARAFSRELEEVTDRLSMTRAVALMLELGRALGTILDLKPLAEQILDAIIELLRAERGLLLIYDDPITPETRELATSRSFEVRVSRNLSRESVEDFDDPVTRSVVQTVQRSGRPLVMNRGPGAEPGGEASTVETVSASRSILCFPLKTKRRDYGILCVENRNSTRRFSERHIAFVEPFVSQVALALQKAFAYARTQELLQETLSLERARERIINHISHELETPLAIIATVLRLVERRLSDDEYAQRALRRGERSLYRLMTIKSQMLDIYRARSALAGATEESVDLAGLLRKVVTEALEAAPHRDVELTVQTEDVEILVTRYALEATLAGLVRNAIENTPDGSLVRVSLRRASDRHAVVKVRDFGVGISEENRRHIFDGFYHTQKTSLYSSKSPYDFNAGGKGLDLWRINSFAERYGWGLTVTSERCPFIPNDDDECPGNVSLCAHGGGREVCLQSGHTEFALTVPLSPER